MRRLFESRHLQLETADSAGSAATTGGTPRLVFLLQGIYIAFLVTIFLVRGVGISPDLLFLFLFVGFTWRGRRLAFLRDFGPFVLLLLSYDAMRGYADDLGGKVHILYPIQFDRALFGEVPSVALQRWLFDPPQSQWYDYMGAMLHALHFVIPLVFAAVLWQSRRDTYWRYVISLLLLSYSGFVTYMLVPTAPPWYASAAGYLPGVDVVHDGLPAISGVYNLLNPNPVAAMPSLHAAFPWLYLLFAVRIWGARGLVFLLYIAPLYFSLMYLGHHYVADIAAGTLYASVVFAVCATDYVPGRLSVLLARARNRSWLTRDGGLAGARSDPS